MNREDIIRMARESMLIGLNDDEYGDAAQLAVEFAALIAEDCAKRCEDVGDQYDGTETTWAAESCAAAIREAYKP